MRVSEALTSGSRLTAERSGMTPSQEEYRTIPLTRGQVAIVDASEYAWLNQWKWCAQWNECTHSFYAVRKYGVGGGRTMTLSMHRAILGLGYLEKRQCDHINGDTLDNRHSNLRMATHSENMRNRPMMKTNKSGFKGVYLRKGKKENPWRAEIQKDKKRITLGYFPTPEDAHAAYATAAKQLFGEFARTA